MGFYIGVAKIEIGMPYNRSLKDKRQIIKSVIDRFYRSNTIAISEIDNHDVWKSACLGVVCICGRADGINEIVTDIRHILESSGGIEVQSESQWIFKPEEE